MTRAEVLERLRAHRPTLAERFGVVELALFGSFARDAATEASDVDILVRFDASPNWRDYFGAQFYLEDLLQRPVELATRDDVRAEMRPQVEREAVDV
ncbi:MAG: nucleotidyltransferase family protein [Chloroflexota bacterium]|nr:nucleotidyltransferase family protein [Chloroflexota bacterium]MDE2899191.1 nucleotidyltransferase family protein [Chloroflexota bacterium]